MNLEEFISSNRQIALSIIHKSNNHKYLDHMDIEEIVHCGLWKCHTLYNPKRAALSTFIYIVITSYMNSILRKKLKISSKECSLEQVNRDSLSYILKEDIQESFTPTEWELVSPLTENSKNKSSRILNLRPKVYDKIIASVKKKLIKRGF